MEDYTVIQSLLSVLFSEEIASNFVIKRVKEYREHIEIKLEELRELVPLDLSKVKEVELDGFCNPLELQSFPMKGKAVYLKIYRRRWKAKGSKRHYSNTYDLHQKGVKATKEFSSFLKDAFGYTPSQYNNDIKSSLHKE